MTNDFYVYAHIRLDTWRIFYVGKGRGNRCRRRERNKHWRHIVQKAGYETKFLEFNISEEEAFQKEKFHIKRLKLEGQCEANYSDGGEGCSGYKWTEEQKLRHSKRLKNQTKAMREGHKVRVKSMIGRTKETHSGVKTISIKASGAGNGRAIWDIITPEGIFTTIKAVAKFYKISTAAVHKRLESSTEKFNTWKRVKKETEYVRRNQTIRRD